MIVTYLLYIESLFGVAMVGMGNLGRSEVM